VLINVPTREALLQEMISLLRLGGTIALEDVDDISYTCVPLHPSWTALLDAFHTAFHANGGKAYIGRDLVGYLRGAGIKNIRVKIHVGTINPGGIPTHAPAVVTRCPTRQGDQFWCFDRRAIERSPGSSDRSSQEPRHAADRQAARSGVGPEIKPSIPTIDSFPRQGLMSALGQKQTLAVQKNMSALPPKADICGALTKLDGSVLFRGITPLKRT
jgi:hypothetical protein